MSCTLCQVPEAEHEASIATGGERHKHCTNCVIAALILLFLQSGVAKLALCNASSIEAGNMQAAMLDIAIDSISGCCNSLHLHSAGWVM